MRETKWCQRQDSCPLLLGAIEAKVEAEYKARVAKHNQDASAQEFETKRTHPAASHSSQPESRCQMSRTRYKFKGYTITNCGYHQPDHCVWWEAVDENGEACFHGHSLREVEFMILDDEWEQKLRAKERKIENLKSSCAAIHKALKQASYFLNKHHMGGVYAPDGETLIYCWDVAKIVDEALAIQMPYDKDAQNA